MREERALLLGDACNDRTLLFDGFAPPVADYRAALLALEAETSGACDRALLSHGDGEGAPDMLARVIAVCGDVMDGRDDFPIYELFAVDLKRDAVISVYDLHFMRRGPAGKKAIPAS